MTRQATCANCIHLPIAALQAAGAGECSMFGRPEAFDRTACVIYERARDLEVRRALVIRLKQQKENSNG